MIAVYLSVTSVNQDIVIGLDHAKYWLNHTLVDYNLLGKSHSTRAMFYIG